MISSTAPCLPRLPMADLIAAARSVARSISAEGACRGEAVLAEAAWDDSLEGAARFPTGFGALAGEETDDPIRPWSKLDGAARADQGAKCRDGQSVADMGGEAAACARLLWQCVRCDFTRLRANGPIVGTEREQCPGCGLLRM